MGHDDLYRAGIGMTSQRTRERLLERLFEEGIRNLHVLEAIRRTPRHLFVDEALSHRAYEDTALPIGHNQTLSQPYIVARMTELLLGGGPLDKVMEVGTGSGYQTAILAKVVERVFSVERILPLQERAKRVLRDIDVRNVVFRHADGNWGWPQYGPYDAILVTAAPAEIPRELLGQLAAWSFRLAARAAFDAGCSSRRRIHLSAGRTGALRAAAGRRYPFLILSLRTSV